MFENLLRIFNGSGIIAARTQETFDESQTHVKVKFKRDIEALVKKFGNLLPKEILMSLSEALELMPRDRKRVDAYASLQKYLAPEILPLLGF